ncbi:MAG: aspartate carbamoyltransferase regulatory subunit, partial [Bacteroidales bacterium]|nr:aspartate carbamoyltransferase regulatory subunit [Bacteroidales bacterium]
GIVKCYNPKCITNHEQVTPKFKVLDSQEIKLQCHYCQKITKEETLNFL